MEAAAHTPGGYDGVSQAVGREFVEKDSDMKEADTATKLDAALSRFDRLDQRMADRERADAAARVDARARGDGEETMEQYIRRTGSNSGYGQKYNKEEVDKGINAAYRGTKGPTGKQRSVTHALLRGRD